MRPSSITVNSLGEVFNARRRFDETGHYLAGSLSIGELEEKLGRKAEQKDFDREFKKQVADAVGGDKDAIRYVGAVWRLQKLNNDRFRFWGYRGRIVLSTEFNSWIDNSASWKEARRVSKALGARYVVMYDNERHLDQTIENSGTAQERTINGPNHGRLERQIDIQMTLDEWTTPAARILVRRVAGATQRLWEMAGVSVI